MSSYRITHDFEVMSRVDLLEDVRVVALKATKAGRLGGYFLEACALDALQRGTRESAWTAAAFGGLNPMRVDPESAAARCQCEGRRTASEGG